MTPDIPFRSGDFSGGGATDTAPHFTNWRRTRRASGSVPQSPLDAPHSSSQRRNSGSSGGEETGNVGSNSGGNGGAIRREFDWTLGCGKWRHRSTSGSERGNHKVGFANQYLCKLALSSCILGCPELQ